MPWKSYHTIDVTETYLFKFLPKKRLFDFLNTGSIWFSRADKFGDKMECVRIEDLQVEKPHYPNIEARKKRFLISCWHLADNESLAFWDTYTDTLDNRKNFALRFKRKNLIYNFEDYFYRNSSFYYETKWVHGKVEYKNLLTSNFEKLNKARILYPALRKEGAFKYESEYRFVIELISSYDRDGWYYNIGEPKKLPFDIIINPLLQKESFSELFKEVSNLGFEENIKPSKLTKWLRPDLW